MGEVNADIAAGDDERDGEDNQGDAADDADRERFAEDQIGRASCRERV